MLPVLRPGDHQWVLYSSSIYHRAMYGLLGIVARWWLLWTRLTSPRISLLPIPWPLWGIYYQIGLRGGNRPPATKTKNAILWHIELVIMVLNWLYPIYGHIFGYLSPHAWVVFDLVWLWLALFTEDLLVRGVIDILLGRSLHQIWL